jgi:hypothetical protein
MRSTAVKRAWWILWTRIWGPFQLFGNGGEVSDLDWEWMYCLPWHRFYTIPIVPIVQIWYARPYDEANKRTSDRKTI